MHSKSLVQCRADTHPHHLVERQRGLLALVMLVGVKLEYDRVCDENGPFLHFPTFVYLREEKMGCGEGGGGGGRGGRVLYIYIYISVAG